ncbi:hypothetical protein MKW92_020093, partial [Papaver armeniacum]
MKTSSFSLFITVLCFTSSVIAAEVTELDRIDSNNGNTTAYNKTLSDLKTRQDSFAGMIDRALEKEFPDNEQSGGETDAGSFNNTVAGDKAVLETVARVNHKKNETKEKSFQLHDVFNNENREEDTPTLIDSKSNVFIISNTKSKYPVLQLDLRLISDLVIVFVSATCGGIAFAFAGQPVITGYLLAGSVIGPGGLSFISEMVQVETVAQFGVIFLLFALGLEFSTAKLRVVRSVAVLGGLLQIFLFTSLCGLSASLCGGNISEGIFIGVFLSMSSTVLVLKFLMEKNGINALYGQVTVGTLILQVNALVLGGHYNIFPVLDCYTGLVVYRMRIYTITLDTLSLTHFDYRMNFTIYIFWTNLLLATSFLIEYVWLPSLVMFNRRLMIICVQ